MFVPLCGFLLTGCRDREEAGEEEWKLCLCVMSHHTELAPGGADGSVLHHDAIIRAGFPGVSILIWVIVQGLLLVVLIQLLLWNRDTFWQRDPSRYCCLREGKGNSKTEGNSGWWKQMLISHPRCQMSADGSKLSSYLDSRRETQPKKILWFEQTSQIHTHLKWNRSLHLCHLSVTCSCPF